MMKPITLLTNRLILRRAMPGDDETLFQNYTSDTEQARYLTRLPHKDITQTSQFLLEWCDLPWDTPSNKFAWVVSLKETNQAIGVFLVSQDGAHKAEIHYGIARHFAGQGFTTEFSSEAIRWLIEQPDLQRIWAVSDTANQASIAILKNLGFQKEGLLQRWLCFPAFGGIARDCYVYAYVVNRSVANTF